MKQIIYLLRNIIPVTFLFGVIVGCGNYSPERDAYRFLENNFGHHHSFVQYIVDRNGKTVDFSPYQYEDLYKALDVFDSLCVVHTLFAEFLNDSPAISPETLREHACRMVAVWQQAPCKDSFDINDFYEYVLPYRTGVEKWDDYADTLVHNIASISSMHENMHSTVAAINQKLAGLLVFDLRSHGLLHEPGIPELLRAGMGSCMALCGVVAQSLRLAGIPTSIDECPVWGHRNSGHQWNAYANEKGQWIPFDALEYGTEPFTAISDSVKAPKIFRHTFSSCESCLPPIKHNDIPPALRNPHRVDVTHMYVTASDVEIDVSGDESIIYLSVFNGGEWRIVEWAAVENGKALFRNMGNNNIVYMPAYYRNDEVIPAADPFVLTPHGKKVQSALTDQRKDVKLSHFNVFYDLKWHMGRPSQISEFELCYWDKEWISCGKFIAGPDKYLHYKNVPPGAVYWLKITNWDNTWQRIFTIEDGEQLWF